MVNANQNLTRKIAKKPVNSAMTNARTHGKQRNVPNQRKSAKHRKKFKKNAGKLVAYAQDVSRPLMRQLWVDKRLV